MSLYFERIQLPPSESFRLLRWREHLGEIETLHPNGKTESFSGVGERWHYHSEVELTLIQKGSGIRVVGDHMARFLGPDLIFFGTNLPHYWKGLKPSAGMSLQFNLDSEAFDSIPETEALKDVLADARRGLRLTGKTRSWVQQKLKEMASAGPLWRLALLWQILSTIAEAPASDREILSSRDFAHIENSPYQDQMQTAVRWIFERSLEGKVQMQELLGTIGMSKATFCRQFPKHTGRTFSEFINEIRLEQAQRYLADTSMSIATVAFSSGFENLSLFNRMFRRHTGEAPSAFRRRMQIA